jgi:tetratricopeptide (TPR) repeat protein
MYPGAMHISSKGDYDSAMKDYDEAISLNPGNPVGFFNRGNVQSNAGSYDKADAA